MQSRCIWSQLQAILSSVSRRFSVITDNSGSFLGCSAFWSLHGHHRMVCILSWGLSQLNLQEVFLSVHPNWGLSSGDKVFPGLFFFCKPAHLAGCWCKQGDNILVYLNWVQEKMPLDMYFNTLSNFRERYKIPFQFYILDILSS